MDDLSDPDNALPFAHAIPAHLQQTQMAEPSSGLSSLTNVPPANVADASEVASSQDRGSVFPVRAVKAYKTALLP